MPPTISSLTLPLDADAVVPIILLDQVGRPYKPDASASLASSDSTIFTAAIGSAADGSPVANLVSVAVGSGALSFTDGAATASIPVTVVTPAPISAGFGEPSFTAKA